ncbi:unnamed protein product [Heterobilharzia americana]|nr:unnamed protein product [Heterobilharzia americana]
MKAEDHCFICNQIKCIGKRVEYVPSNKKPAAKTLKGGIQAKKGKKKGVKKIGRSTKKAGKVKKKKKEK